MASIAQSLACARDFWLATRKYGLSPIAAAVDFYRLAGPQRYSPTEIFRLGLLDASSGLARIGRSTSKERLLAIQRRLNRRDAFHLTEHKVDFDARCQAAGLPTPALLAVYAPDERASERAPVLTTASRLARFLDAVPANDVVVKPAQGTHGDGVLVLSRDGDGWDSGERRLSSDDIAAGIASSAYAHWLVQERLFADPALGSLTGTDLLQTTRVVTLRDVAGNTGVLLAWLRITAGAGRTDNFNFGTAGHIVAPVDVASGRLGVAVRMSADALGLEAVDRHPRSGVALKGFTVPHWPAVVDLAHRAADAFAPLVTVGWDIAITPSGPCLIEGNVTWDPLPANPDLPAAVERLRAVEAGGAVGVQAA